MNKLLILILTVVTAYSGEVEDPKALRMLYIDIYKQTCIYVYVLYLF